MKIEFFNSTLSRRIVLPNLFPSCFSFHCLHAQSVQGIACIIYEYVAPHISVNCRALVDIVYENELMEIRITAESIERSLNGFFEENANILNAKIH